MQKTQSSVTLEVRSDSALGRVAVVDFELLAHAAKEIRGGATGVPANTLLKQEYGSDGEEKRTAPTAAECPVLWTLSQAAQVQRAMLLVTWLLKHRQATSER